MGTLQVMTAQQAATLAASADRVARALTAALTRPVKTVALDDGLAVLLVAAPDYGISVSLEDGADTPSVVLTAHWSRPEHGRKQRRCLTVDDAVAQLVARQP